MRLLVSSLIAGALAVAACGDDDAGPTASQSPQSTEVQSRTPEPSPTATAALTATPTTPPTVSPVRTPTVYPSPPPVPDDWLTFTDPDGLFIFRYPPNWTSKLQGSKAVYSFDAAVVTPAPGYAIPDENVKVEVLHGEVAQLTACGVFVKDPAGELVVQTGAAEWPLGGIPGWLSVSHPTENVAGLLIPSVTTSYKGYCFTITGYFTQAEPDVQTFLQIAASFEFTF